MSHTDDHVQHASDSQQNLDWNIARNAAISMKFQWNRSPRVDFQAKSVDDKISWKIEISEIFDPKMLQERLQRTGFRRQIKLRLKLRIAYA